MHLSAPRLSHTLIRLHTHIFPKPLLNSGPRLHVACSHVLSALEQLSLPPSSIDSFAIMGCCGLWSCWGRSSGSDGQRSGDSRRGCVEALKERWPTRGWHSPVRCMKQGRRCQRCYALHNRSHSVVFYNSFAACCDTGDLTGLYETDMGGLLEVEAGESWRQRISLHQRQIFHQLRGYLRSTAPILRKKYSQRQEA